MRQPCTARRRSSWPTDETVQTGPACTTLDEAQCPEPMGPGSQSERRRTQGLKDRRRDPRSSILNPRSSIREGETAAQKRRPYARSLARIARRALRAAVSYVSRRECPARYESSRVQAGTRHVGRASGISRAQVQDAWPSRPPRQDAAANWVLDPGLRTRSRDTLRLRVDGAHRPNQTPRFQPFLAFASEARPFGHCPWALGPWPFGASRVSSSVLPGFMTTRQDGRGPGSKRSDPKSARHPLLRSCSGHQLDLPQKLLVSDVPTHNI